MIIVATDKKAELLLALPPLWLQMNSDVGANFFMAVATLAQIVWPNKREALNKPVI
jgi:hypothetical protein